MIHPARSARGRTLRAVAAVLVFTAFLVAGCTDQRGPAVRSGVDEVVYITGFGTFGREAGAYVAEQFGMFADAGIDVEIQPGTGAAANTALVVAGAAQFALTDLSGAILLAGTGQATGFRAVAAVHQLAPIGILTLDDEITNPRQLEGARLADSSASVGRLLWPAYANLAGVDADRVDLVDAAPPQLPRLLAAGTVDAIGQFHFGQPTIEAAAGGRQAQFMAYSDELTELYGIAVITSTQMVETNPDLVQRFTSALLAGVVYAVNHPQEAGQVLADAVADGQAQVAQTAAAELVLMEPYVQVIGVPVGSIDEVRVAQSIALLEAAGAIPWGELTADEVVAFDLVPTG